MFNITHTTEEIALHNVDKYHEFMKNLIEDTKENIEMLENEGWKIEFNHYSDVVGNNKRTVCVAKKVVGEGKMIAFQRKAKVAPGDIYSEEVGEYLALSRIITAIKGE